MELRGLTIGYALTGSYCTFEKTFKTLKEIVAMKNNVIPIVSENVYRSDTRFGTSKNTLAMLEELTGNGVVCGITEAEQFGPRLRLDLLIVAPCTSNTLSKFANGITDTTVTMAMKAHIRSQKAPLCIALCSNDALGNTLRNIGYLMNVKNVYFTPMYEDDQVNKPNSMVAAFDKLILSCELALDGKQMRGVFCGG